jgi:hypothetical protein
VLGTRPDRPQRPQLVQQRPQRDRRVAREAHFRVEPEAAAVRIGGRVERRQRTRDERVQVIERAQVALLGQPPIERGDGDTVDDGAVSPRHLDVRTAQQHHQGGSRVARERHVHQEVEAGRARFGGERQRRRRLERHASRSQHLLRGVEVRQRAAVDHRTARPVGDAERLDPPGERQHFVLAIAAVDPAAVGRRHFERRAWRLLGRHAHVDGVRPAAAQPREQGIGQSRRGHDVEALEAAGAGHQIEVDRPESLRLGVMIGDRDHDVPRDPWPRRLPQPGP